MKITKIEETFNKSAAAIVVEPGDIVYVSANRNKQFDKGENI